MKESQKAHNKGFFGLLSYPLDIYTHLCYIVHTRLTITLQASIL